MIMTQLKEMFDHLRPLLQPYEKKLTNKSRAEGNYELYSVKKLTALGKERDEMFFAALMTKKNYVGFYFMPIYTHPQEFKDVPVELKKCLKGKSCFHIKKPDALLDKQIKELLKKGWEVYKKEGWV